MGTIERHLMPGERVIHRANLHPIVLSACAAYAAAAVGIVIGSLFFRVPWLTLLSALPLLLCVPAWLDFRSSQFAVTERRLLVKRGWLTTRTNEALLSKLGTIGVEQGLLGRALGFGRVFVKGPGGAQEILESISDPIRFSREIQAQMVRLETKSPAVSPASSVPIIPTPDLPTVEISRFPYQA